MAAPANTDVVPLEKQQPTVIPIVSQSDELESNGTYKFSYETANGIKREETSYNKVLPKGRSADSNEGGENNESDEIHVQIGSYSYTAPDGTLISVRYIADENGFQPIGDHIPRVPGLSTSSSTEEKSGRALNIADNAGSGSAPASKSAQKSEAPEEHPGSEGSGDQKSTPVSVDARSAKSTAEAKASESAAKASTTEEAKSTEAVAGASTTEAVEVTEAAKTTETSDVSTIEATKTTEAADASTTDVAKTAEGNDASTTEAAKVTTEAEASTTEAVQTTEAIKTTEEAEANMEGANVSTTEASRAAAATV
ncbi:late embryogenesis abundant protein, group 3-like [Hyposmocoma kahamanoa]|uniref:late embryogenesis abundant protein, group 3-like n=1 Tax=Hyposmocoma kahamanoa TaxID=1477025 RepID=UPI000E6D6DB5|nr:late embryogenesis abundant protein, group 3-like [Hyposmocoma kahamanoa]